MSVSDNVSSSAVFPVMIRSVAVKKYCVLLFDRTSQKICCNSVHLYANANDN